MLFELLSAASSLTTQDLRRALAPLLETDALNESAERKWRRWSSGAAVPTARALHDVVRAARARGWLPEDRMDDDVRRLLEALETEVRRARDEEVERARARMAPDAIRLAIGIERLAAASGTPADVALPAALQAVAEMSADRMRTSLGPGQSHVAHGLARTLAETFRRLGDELKDQEQQLLDELLEERLREEYGAVGVLHLRRP